MSEGTTIRVAMIPFLMASCLTAAMAGDWFGAPPDRTEVPLDIAEVMAEPQARVGQHLTVSGRMTDVCTNKGCWAVLESDGEMLRIVVRDHGFVIPEDARGAAVAYGVFKRQEISPEVAEHMVEEDGADPSLLNEPAAYRLVADGVRLLR